MIIEKPDTRTFSESELWDLFRKIQHLGSRVRFGDRMYCIESSAPNMPYVTFCKGVVTSVEAKEDGVAKSFEEIFLSLIEDFISGIEPDNTVILRSFPVVTDKIDFLTGNRLIFIQIRFYNLDYRGYLHTPGSNILIKDVV